MVGDVSRDLTPGSSEEALDVRGKSATLISRDLTPAFSDEALDVRGKSATREVGDVEFRYL
jgi:hypothetical protein